MKLQIIFFVGCIFFCLKDSFGFDYVLHKEFVPRENIAQPAKNQWVTNSHFHTRFKRVTDVSGDNLTASGNRMATVIYSRWTPLSSGQDYLYFQRDVGNPDALIYSAKDNSLIKILPDRITIDGQENQYFLSMESAEIRWDYTGKHPHRFYYVNGPRLLQYDVSTDEAQVVHDFSTEFPNCSYVHNDVEGDCSADSRYWAFMVRASSDKLLAIITYDRQTDTIIGKMDFESYQAYGGKHQSLPIPNMVEISPSGRKVIYHLSRNGGEDQDTYFDGAHAWDLNFTNPVKASITSTHSGWAWGYNGRELFVSQNNRTDWIEARDILTGETMEILYNGDLGWYMDFHFARMPKIVKGWILMSTCKEGDGQDKDWGDSQLLMIEVKDKSDQPRVWRLGHTHNNHNEYYAEGFAAISQYGDRFWWGAKWPGQNHIEAYEMELPDKWWEDLAGNTSIYSKSQNHPAEFTLSFPYPNPFNSSTTIRYSLEEAANVTLDIYNMLGQKIKSLLTNQWVKQGKHQLTWNACDEAHQLVNSGVYFLQIQVNNVVKRKKIIYVK